MSGFASLTFYITKASISDGVRRFSATASDTELDTYKERMTETLFDNFIRHIERKSPVPNYPSRVWNGGLPYVSLSHLLDYDGKMILGDITSVYRDGNKLKIKGTFRDTPLGQAAYRAVKKDITDNVEHRNRVRISIMFLDLEHVHKTDSGDVMGTWRYDVGQPCGLCHPVVRGEKSYLDGILVHVALTRKPAVRRTEIYLEGDEMEEFQKADAISIVGEELVEEILEVVGRSEKPEISEGMVIKSDFTLEALRAVLREELRQQAPAHDLDTEIFALKAAYDAVKEKSEAEAVPVLQNALDVLAQAIERKCKPKKEMPSKMESDADVLAQAITKSLSPIVERIEIAVAAANRVAATPETVPAQRQASPLAIRAQKPASENSPTKLRQIINRSVGLSG